MGVLPRFGWACHRNENIRGIRSAEEIAEEVRLYARQLVGGCAGTLIDQALRFPATGCRWSVSETTVLPTNTGIFRETGLEKRPRTNLDTVHIGVRHAAGNRY